MIAPLWADLQVYASGAVYSRVSYDPGTLNQVVRMLTDLNPALSDYQPSLAVIATWFEPSIFYDVGGPQQLASYALVNFSGIIILKYTMQGTFQVILSTDGVVSFAVFIYDKLEFIDQVESYQIGFDSGVEDSKYNMFLNIAGSEQAEYTGNLQEISVFRVDGMMIICN